MTSGAVAAILHSTWTDIAVSGVIGVLIGAIALASEGRPRLAASFEAVSALLATLIATAVGTWLVALNVKAVVLAALIVLLPGLSLTTAVRELSTQHLASGVARLAGAMMSLLKLAFGTLAATQIAVALHWVPKVVAPGAVPPWAQWVALGFGCLSFAVLFQAARRDYVLVMASAALGYVGLANYDRVGAAVFGDTLRDYLAPVRGRAQVFRFFSFLADAQPEGQTSLAAALRDYTLRCRRTGIAILISDFLDPGWEEGLKALLFRKFQTTVIQVLDAREVRPDFRGDLKLIDAETGGEREISISPALLREYDRNCDGTPETCTTFEYNADLTSARVESDDGCDGMPEDCYEHTFDAEGRIVHDVGFLGCTDTVRSCTDFPQDEHGNRTGTEFDANCDGVHDNCAYLKYECL